MRLFDSSFARDFIKERAVAKQRGPRLLMDDLREFRRQYLDPVERREALLYYYTSTPEGRRELEDSPHRDRPVEAVVDDLCREIDSWGDDGMPPQGSE